MHSSEIKSLLNLSLIMLLKLMIFVCVKALIMLLLFLEQAPTWSVGHHVGDPCCRQILEISQQR